MSSIGIINEALACAYGSFGIHHKQIFFQGDPQFIPTKRKEEIGNIIHCIEVCQPNAGNWLQFIDFQFHKLDQFMQSQFTVANQSLNQTGFKRI